MLFGIGCGVGELLGAFPLEHQRKSGDANAGVMNDVAVDSQNAASKDQTRITYGGFSFTKTDATGTDLTGAKFAIKNPSASTSSRKTACGRKSLTLRNPHAAATLRTTRKPRSSPTPASQTAPIPLRKPRPPNVYLSTAKVTFDVIIKSGVAVHFDETDLINSNNDRGFADGNDAITDYQVKNYKTISCR